jgi:anti-sigma factor RsiW
MNCPDEIKLNAYHDGELDAGETAEVRMHASGCADCAKRLLAYEKMRSAVRVEEPLPDAAYFDALKARVLAEAAKPPAEPAVRRGRTPALFYFAAAAAVLILLGIIFIIPGGQRLNPVASKIKPAPPAMVGTAEEAVPEFTGYALPEIEPAALDESGLLITTETETETADPEPFSLDVALADMLDESELKLSEE